MWEATYLLINVKAVFYNHTIDTGHSSRLIYIPTSTRMHFDTLCHHCIPYDSHLMAFLQVINCSCVQKKRRVWHATILHEITLLKSKSVGFMKATPSMIMPYPNCINFSLAIDFQLMKSHLEVWWLTEVTSAKRVCSL